MHYKAAFFRNGPISAIVDLIDSIIHYQRRHIHKACIQQALEVAGETEHHANLSSPVTE